MKLKFLGASQTVTGSRTLVEANGKRILVDCGLFQGLKFLRLKNRDAFQVDPKSIDAILLTHAHLDHSGYLPLLVKEGFEGPIYSTSATKDLCGILLPDSGYLQEEEARYANQKGFSKHKPAIPLYTQKDAVECLRSFRVVPFKEVLELGNGLQAKFFPSGHLFGASSILIDDGRTKVAFSGDLGRTNDPLLLPPEFPENVDYAVIESTYGNRVHATIDPLKQIAEVINRTYKRGGAVIVPSFAVGRAQLLLHYVNQLRSEGKIPPLPVYLNSPMASKANSTWAKHADESRLSRAEIRDACGVADIISSPEESIELNERSGPMVIIAASGMATGGRVLHHIKKFAPDEKNTLMFVGFQAAGTRGEAIVHGASEVKIHGEYWPIRAEIVNLDSLSAHADQIGLLNWISDLPSRPKKVFLNHGEPAAIDALRMKIEEKLHIDAIAAEHLMEVNI